MQATNCHQAQATAGVETRVAATKDGALGPPRELHIDTSMIRIDAFEVACVWDQASKSWKTDAGCSHFLNSSNTYTDDASRPAGKSRCVTEKKSVNEDLKGMNLGDSYGINLEFLRQCIRTGGNRRNLTP